MRPVGEARIRKHLLELDGLLKATNPDELSRIINCLLADRYRRSWASSFETLAEHWPQVLNFVLDRPKRESWLDRQKERQNEG